MKNRINIFAITVLLLSLSAQAHLNQLMAQEYSHPDHRHWQVMRASLQEYHVVFVGFTDGFFKPLKPFRDNINTLKKDLGLTSVSMVRTHFLESYDDNTISLLNQLQQAYLMGKKKPLVIIGNPKSGTDVLYTVLKFPHLLTEGVVTKLVLLQSAFGTPLVDSAYSSSMGGPTLEFVKNYFGQDLHKFQTGPTRMLFNRAIGGLSEQERELLYDRLYWVRSAANPLQVTPFLVAPYLFMRPGGATDSITYTKDQKIEGIGHDLGIVIADHWDLFATFPASSKPAHFRKAFTRALLRQIFNEKMDDQSQ